MLSGADVCKALHEDAVHPSVSAVLGTLEEN